MSGVYLTREERRVRDAQIFRAFQGGRDLPDLMKLFGLSRSNLCRIVRDEARRTGERMRKVKKISPLRKKEGPKCLHCRDCVATRPRGLCYGCYYVLEIRDSYATLREKYAPSEIADFNGAAKKPKVPTDTLPGTPERTAVYEERARLGMSLWHPADLDPDAEDMPPGYAECDDGFKEDD